MQQEQRKLLRAILKNSYCLIDLRIDIVNTIKETDSHIRNGGCGLSVFLNYLFDLPKSVSSYIIVLLLNKYD